LLRLEDSLLSLNIFLFLRTEISAICWHTLCWIEKGREYLSGSFSDICSTHETQLSLFVFCARVFKLYETEKRTVRQVLVRSCRWQ